MHQAEFHFVGRIAKITDLNGVTKVRAIANYRRKKSGGTEYEDDPYSVELSVFGDGRRSYVNEHLEIGDLIRAAGKFKEDSYEKDGQRIYGTTFFVDDIGRLARPSGDRDAI